MALGDMRGGGRLGGKADVSDRFHGRALRVVGKGVAGSGSVWI